jgi:paraquat-inducible protein B
MSKQANKTLVGVFVIGAVALLVGALLTFGSGRLFKRTVQFVAFFDGSVKGLNVGAPVNFRGVKIGEVTEIHIYSDPKTLEVKLPVIMDLYPERIESGTAKSDVSPRMAMNNLIRNGLRAQLQPQSLLTGQLFVQLDYHEDQPVKLVGTEGLGFEKDIFEVPTISSFNIQELTRKIDKLPLEEIAYSVRASLDGIEKIINSPEVHRSIKLLPETIEAVQTVAERANSRIDRLTVSADETLQDLRKLVNHLNAQVDPLGNSVLQTSKAARESLTEARDLLQHVNQRITSIEDDLSQTTAAFRSAMKQAETTLSSFEGVFEENSAARYTLDQFLTELTYAAQSVRSLAEMLERNPDAIIRGKRGAKKSGGN